MLAMEIIIEPTQVLLCIVIIIEVIVIPLTNDISISMASGRIGNYQSL